MRIQFIHGSALDVLKTFRDNTFQTVVTSPPYWQQRDYQVNDQIGQEATVEEYVDNMVKICREIKRTLRQDGTFWLNIGDTFVRSDIKTDLRNKNKIGVPWLLARSLQQPFYNGCIKDERDRVWLSAMIDAEGSICGSTHLRKDDGKIRTNVYINITNSNNLILNKALSIFPESSRVEHTKAGEGHLGQRAIFRWVVFGAKEKSKLLQELYPYLVAKKKQAAVAWNFLEYQKSGKKLARTPQKNDINRLRQDMIDLLSRLNKGSDEALPEWMKEPPSLYEHGWILRQDIIWNRENPMPDGAKTRPTTSHEYMFLLTKSEDYYYDYFATLEDSENIIKGKQKFGSREQVGTNRHDQQREFEHYGKRNKRSVWTTPVSRFEGSHWATFHPDLIEPCILAGTSTKGCCPKCKTPWNRIMSKTRNESGQLELTGNIWEPGCSCGIAETEPCLVLDPFSGASTTGFVCAKHHRDYVAIDVNEEYLNVAKKRLGSNDSQDIFLADYVTEYKFNSDGYFDYGNNL